MIFNVLNTVSYKLNDFLRLKFGSNEDQLEITNLLEQDGNLAISDTNKVIGSLVNIERETSMGVNPKVEFNNNHHTLSSAPVFVNIYLLFTSLFTGKNYTEGLKYLSAIIDFLQGNSCINHKNTPQLSKNIEKITFEVVSLDIQTLSQLWGAIGGKYMPSVLYKIRMLTIDQTAIKAEVPGIKEPVYKTST